jgi:hypothetical protein
MFVDKQELIAIFENEFEAWERLLAGLSMAQITNPYISIRRSWRVHTIIITQNTGACLRPGFVNKRIYKARPESYSTSVQHNRVEVHSKGVVYEKI